VRNALATAPRRRHDDGGGDDEANLRTSSGLRERTMHAVVNMCTRSSATARTACVRPCAYLCSSISAPAVASHDTSEIWPIENSMVERPPRPPPSVRTAADKEDTLTSLLVEVPRFHMCIHLYRSSPWRSCGVRVANGGIRSIDGDLRALLAAAVRLLSSLLMREIQGAGE
jgi:hypothetical protein